MKDNVILKETLKLILISGMVLSAEFLWASPPSRAMNTDTIVEYSLQGLKGSAQQMADRNAWLVSQITQMKDQIPALQQRLTLLEGQKEKYQLLAGEDLTSRTLKKYMGEGKDKFPMLKGRSEFQEEQRMLEEKINQKEIESQNFKENKIKLQEEVNQFQYELGLLDTELKDVGKKDEWHDLIRTKEQSLKRLKNAERSLVQLNGKFVKPEEQLRNLEQEQKNLQQHLGELENELNISFNQENDIRQEILKVRGLHAPRITQLNQDVEQLKLKVKEIEDTISQIHTKISEKKIQLGAAEYADTDLKKSLELITHENAALKTEMISLKENLIKIESLR